MNNLKILGLIPEIVKIRVGISSRIHITELFIVLQFQNGEEVPKIETLKVVCLDLELLRIHHRIV